MYARAFTVAAAIAAAALLTPTITLLAKDDPAALKAAQDAVRKDLKEAKKVPSADLAYVIDTTKLKDGRWTFKDVAPPTDEIQGLMFHAEFPSGNATDTSSSISVVIQKCAHVKKEANGTATMNRPFKAWGKSVEMADLDGIAEGEYQEFILTATDAIPDKCTPPSKKGAVGPAKLWGSAVATDKESKKRVRKDWFLWIAQDKRLGGLTWWAEATTAEKFIDTPEWNAKLVDLMKNIVELKDKRLK